MITLFGTASSRAFRCIWTCEELGIPYRLEEVDFRTAGRSPAYLAVNPYGRVPAMDDDGFVLWESMAIDLYLVDRYGEGTLLPATVQARGDVYRWTLWAACEFEGAVDAAARLGMRMRPDWLATRLAVLDAALAGRTWLVDEAFTLADLHVAAMCMRPAVPWNECLADGAYGHAGRWFDACCARPGFQRMQALRTSGH